MNESVDGICAFSSPRFRFSLFSCRYVRFIQSKKRREHIGRRKRQSIAQCIFACVVTGTFFSTELFTLWPFVLLLHFWWPLLDDVTVNGLFRRKFSQFNASVCISLPYELSVSEADGWWRLDLSVCHWRPQVCGQRSKAENQGFVYRLGPLYKHSQKLDAFDVSDK